MSRAEELTGGEEARCCCLQVAHQDFPKAGSRVFLLHGTPLLGLLHPGWWVPSLASDLCEDLGHVSLSRVSPLAPAPRDQHKGKKGGTEEGCPVVKGQSCTSEGSPPNPKIYASHKSWHHTHLCTSGSKSLCSGPRLLMYSADNNARLGWLHHSKRHT